MEYNCTPFTPRQGTHVRTQGNSAVNLQGYGWYTYNNWQATFPTQAGYSGQAALIRPLFVEPGRQRVVVFPPSGQVTDENGAQSFFDVFLDGLQAPTSTVFIDVSSSDPGEISVAPMQLRFDQFNWRIPQRVTLTGVDDPLIDGNQAAQINLAISPLTGDPCWINIPVPQVSAINNDNELVCGGGWIDRTSGSTLGRSPAARFDHAMVYDAPNRRLVVFGGENATGGKLGDTWFWDGAAWTQALIPGPSPRSGHAMAYDSQRQTIYLFGGVTASIALSSQTWQFNGGSWALLSPGPSARQGAALAYDANRHEVILHGGFDGAALLDDTWMFNGSTWFPIAPAVGRPGARSEHTIVYDALDRRVRIFGGDAGPSMTWGDNWSFNGANWLHNFPHHPWGLAHHAASYDVVRNRTVVFGGGDSGLFGVYGDTWERGYLGWTHAIPAGAGSPAARHSHAMAYDTRRGVTLLFGGVDAGGTVRRDLWEYSRGGAPTITANPAGFVTAAPGVTLTLGIAATNAAMYQWRFDGEILLNHGPYTGAHTATLTISPVDFAQAGIYDCIVSNPCGETLSPATRLRVGCVADVDDGSLTGTPDGGVTIEDLVYYLYIFNLGLYPDCDVDDGSGTGTPDGGVTIDDLLYFLYRFDLGC